MKKQLISSIASMSIIMNTMGFNLTANAKVIEPEIVKTETWTTSYYIDDNIETLYPYIKCEADIYNDGTIHVYAWNTYQWTGPTTAMVEHTATFIEAAPIRYGIYTSKKAGCTKYNLNFYPDTYSMSCSGSDYYYVKWDDYGSYIGINIPCYKGYLSQMLFCENRPGINNFQSTLSLRPTGELTNTNTYNFKIYGHDITITPDLLQSTSMPEPPVNETESLKSENESLKAELNALKISYDQLSATLANQKNRSYGDMNDDGFVDGRDASLLLTYYAKTSVGYTGTLDNFIQEQNKAEN